MQFQGKHIMTITAVCEPAKEIGQDGSGCLRVIPIIGGTVSGIIHGTVVPGGADWNTERPNGISHVFAKYMLLTDDGEGIAIENEGKIDFSKASVAKTTPRFQTREDGPYGYLNSGVYVGTLEPSATEGAVEIVIYQLD